MLLRGAHGCARFNESTARLMRYTIHRLMTKPNGIVVAAHAHHSAALPMLACAVHLAVQCSHLHCTAGSLLQRGS